MPRYSILSIDGGGVNVLMSLLFMKRLEQARPGFLRATHLFAGTSAGGISAIIVAANSDPAAGVDQAIQFWEAFPQLLRRSRQFVSGFAGTAPLYSHDRLRAALIQTLGTRTLRQIEQSVLVASMQLDNENTVPERRQWRPRSLSNLRADGDVYLDVLLADVAMRTAAAPVMWPVFQGHVDGGLFANDPSMLALTRVLADRGDATRAGGHARDVLEEITLLSIGEGAVPHYLPVQNDAWGYREWFLHRGTPMALIELALNSSGEAISEQCQMLLGDRQYFRLNPDTKFPGGRGVPDLHPRSTLKRGVRWALGETEHALDPIHAQLERARTLGETYNLDDVVAWIDASQWITDVPTEADADSP